MHTEFWEAKFARNVERDRRTAEALEKDGWTVVTVWECQLKKGEIEHTRTYLYTTLCKPDGSVSDEDGKTEGH